MREEESDVTFVTRNDKVAVVEMLGYALFLWYVTHQSEAEQLKDRLRQCWDKAIHRVSVWQALGAIRSLPETDSDG